MKTTGLNKQGAFTLLELVVSLCVIAALALLFSPILAMPGVRASKGKCTSNLKQLGVSFRMFANDNDDRFPYAVTNSLGYQNSRIAWMHFQAMSNEIGSIKVLLCPGDVDRLKNVAVDFSNGPEGIGDVSRRNLALSYFVGLGADGLHPQALLTGDRNIAANPSSAPYSSVKGAVIVPVTSRWTMAKSSSLHGTNGNYGLADGSVQQATGLRLQEQLQKATNAYGTNINLFLFPQ